MDIFGFFSKLCTVLSANYAGSLKPLNDVALTAVKAAVTEQDDGIDQLRAVFTKWREDNPVASQAIVDARRTLNAMGIPVPSQDVVITHVKAAIAEVATGLFPSVDLGGLAPVSATGIREVYLAGADFGKSGDYTAIHVGPAAIAAGIAPGTSSSGSAG